MSTPNCVEGIAVAIITGMTTIAVWDSTRSWLITCISGLVVLGVLLLGYWYLVIKCTRKE